MRKLLPPILIFSLLAIVGCQGPPGPPGPAGPPGSGGGPPYVWVCTPANYFSGSNTPGDVLVFNGSATTANVAVHFLNKDGTNLTGVTVPGSAPPVTYPGQAGASTVPLSSAHTLIVSYQTAQGNPAGGGNVLATVRVVSDQPVAVGSNIQFSGFHPVPCSLLPK
jgi:hypothetical protein